MGDFGDYSDYQSLFSDYASDYQRLSDARRLELGRVFDLSGSGKLARTETSDIL